MDKFKKALAKSDMKFWTKLSDFQEAVVYLSYRMGRPYKRELKKLMAIERKISQIQL